MKLKLMGVLLGSALMVNAVCADTLLSHPVEQWVDFQSADARFTVPEDLAGVVFYRRAQDLNGPSTNVYVDGEYLASLLPNGFRYTLVCPKNQRFDAEFTGVTYDNGYVRKAQAGDYAELPAGSISYFKVVADANGRPKVVRMKPDEARADLHALREQTHTLPRVERRADCAAQPAMLHKFTLDAGALFAFDRADYANMLPEGKREISNVATQIRQRGLNISRIAVVGHTDPEGADDYNQRLSYARAQTVKQALGEAGLDAGLIQAEGKGEQNLLVSDCRQQHPRNASARKQCDQPNRRVEIILYGADAR